MSKYRCSDCWYFVDGKCDAHHADAKPDKSACSDFANKHEDD